MASGGAVAYLRVEKPCFLFLVGSTGIVAAADIATTAPLVTSAARAGTSAVRAASLIDCLVMGAPAPAPGTGSSATFATLGEGGAGSHLSGRARPPSLSSSSSSDDEYSEVAGEESPCFLRSRNSSLFYSQRSRRRILFSFLRVARSCSRCYAVRTLGLEAWADRTTWHSRSPSTGAKRKIRPRRRAASKRRERGLKFQSPADRGGA
jgi:hypothetical protein